MNKCIKLLIISLLLIIVLPMAKLSAQVSTWDGTCEPWTHGTGTEVDPFLIENAQQLAYLAYRVNNGLDAGGGHVSNHNLHYKLMVDVDLNGSEDFQWTPIGYWNSSYDYQRFGGYFDGNRHTIYKVYINNTDYWVGFFGLTGGADIRNLTINGTITTSRPIGVAGGIIGDAIETNITNCVNKGNVNSSHCGGLVGTVNGEQNTNIITNCYNIGTINGSSGISGGIVGCNYEGSNASIIIMNCYNIGEVCRGGIIGGYWGTSYYVTNCYYLNTCGGNNTYGGQPMSADAMQSAEFVPILNAGSLTFKKDNQPYINQGYPIFSGFSIETQPASSVELTSAVLNGNYTLGAFNIISQGFEYKKTTDQNYTTVNCTAGQTPFSYELNGLESGATYQYRAFAVANEGKAYGEFVEFTTTIVNTHQIDASALGPGIISPQGYSHVVEGENLTIEIFSFDQSTLDSVKVDDVNVGPVTSYTFNNVTESHIIRAYFSLVSPSDLSPWDGITINEPFYYDNEYYIISPTELAWVARETNLGNSFQGQSIIIMNDLDLGGAQSSPSIWTPIGTESNPFKGYFIGNLWRCKTIKNLYSNNPENNNVGLFGYVEQGGNINHIQLFNVNIVGDANVGGLVGYLKEGLVGCCGVSGHIEGNQNVGGLIGFVDKCSTEYMCFSVANVEAAENAGGLIGTFRAYDEDDNPEISESCSAGIVCSQGVSGGLIGCIDLGSSSLNHGNLSIKDCYSNATVIGSKCGGLIGERTMNVNNNYYSGILSINDSYVSGYVKDGYGFIALDNNANGEIALCSNCFFDTQSTGCGDNGLTGVYPKMTSEMTTGVSFGLSNFYWNYTNGLYPQLHYDYESLFEVSDLSLLSASPIFFQNGETSSTVQSNFQVSTVNGVTWSSSNPDVIAINGSYASVNPTINETVTLTATLNGISKQINVTVADPNTILVYQPSDLRYIAEQCNAGETFEGKCIKLMNDIVLPENVPNNMISIGSYPDRPFKGTFDGNGKLITNLYIDQPNTPYQGFFGYTLNANLYNVGLVNITASGRNYTGGMVAYAKNTHLRDCYVNGGTLFALSYCGGLIGYQEQGTNSIVSGCYNTCSVNGNHYVGGLIGFSNYSTVRNSYVAGRVSGQGNGIGAIIGGANEVLMYYCYFSIELTGQTNAIGENNFKDGGEGLTNAQMRDPQFVNTLNQNLMTPVWMADYANHINNGFPIIKWQRPGTGMEEHEAAKSCISLFPNPANDFVIIQSDDSSVSLKHMEVYDVMGRKVMSKVLDGQSQMFSIDKLHAGVYHVRVQIDNGHYTNIKLVVQ